MPAFIILVMIALLVGCFFWWEDDYHAPWRAITAAVAVILIGGGILVSDYTQTQERTIIVEGKDRVEGNSRVYTDGDTLQVADIWFSLNGRRTNSADLYGDLRVCHRYRVTVRGWEFGALSLMPNIDRVLEDLGEAEGCDPQDFDS